jgi:hypothetical protein
MKMRIESLDDTVHCIDCFKWNSAVNLLVTCSENLGFFKSATKAFTIDKIGMTQPVFSDLDSFGG